MIDDQLVLAAERLRDDLGILKVSIRKKYGKSGQVTSDELRKQSARLAESWMVTLASHSDVVSTVSSDYFADLSVRFQRLLTYSEHATKRSKYDDEIAAILQHFTAAVVIPLKRLRASDQVQRNPTITDFVPSAFVGHSFAPADRIVTDTVIQTLGAIGISVVTGEKPKAETIPEKVKGLMDAQHLFVAIFTRRDKIAQKKEWTTTLWVVDEKAYAVGKQKRLILLKERGVGSIGGIQGSDYEFIEFSRDKLGDLVVRLLQIFDVSTRGLRR